MGSYSGYKGKGKLGKGDTVSLGEEELVVKSPPVNYNKDVPKRVKLVSLLDAHLVIVGPNSGERYDFGKSGTVVEVLEIDVPPMLAKRVGGRGCCGASNVDGNKLFELA